MAPKRRRPVVPDNHDDAPSKKPRHSHDASTTKATTTRAPKKDYLSSLSDELLLRILTNLSLPQLLLSAAPVSQRLRRLSHDSQVWKRLYYDRFVLPRALRIPGFRRDGAGGGKLLHCSSRRAVWADGRKGGWVDLRSSASDRNGTGGHAGKRDWKAQYRLRHNWARGKCAVEELRVGNNEQMPGRDTGVDMAANRKMLVKICDGLAITADAISGLRAWDLRTKQSLAHISLRAVDSDSPPTCVALDDQEIARRSVNIAVGFGDGSFGVWRFDLDHQVFVRRYRHEKSINGALVGAAFAYPYLLTATEAVLVSLYTFERPAALHDEQEAENDSETERGSESETARETESCTEDERGSWRRKSTRPNKITPSPTSRPISLPAPYLLTSLRSHTSRAPLSLSLRRSTGNGGTIASVAYTFSTLRGWALGIQDLHIQPASAQSQKSPGITTTRLASTLPFNTLTSQGPSPPTSPVRNQATSPQTRQVDSGDGPISICYTHPYLLATLPDNTLILYICTSNATTLSISPGIRLWGHTSGISDAEITARGKAVSVSCRGEEIRVWELEGRAGGRSVAVHPTTAAALAGLDVEDTAPPAGASDVDDDGRAPEKVDMSVSSFYERRNWVGFDDEMVIVLKESLGRESLMVYDFT